MQPNTHSLDGREWARISQLKVGDLLELDDDFTCGIAGRTLPVVGIRHGAEPMVNVECDEGLHDLSPNATDGDDRDGDHIVGAWPAAVV